MEEPSTGKSMRDELILMYEAQTDDLMSTLTLDDQSYILDLANQKQYRAEIREEQAMEDALELYKTAMEEGAQKNVELFKAILAEVLLELEEENREKDRLQDEWLEAALEDELERQQRGGGGLNVSNHTLSKSMHSRGEMTASVAGPPSIYNDAMSNSVVRRNSNIKMLDLDQKIHNEEKKILQKKLKKAERLLKEVIDEKGEQAAKETRKYKNLKKKIKEYRATLKNAERNDLCASTHSKAVSVMYDWGTQDQAENESENDSSSSSSSEANQCNPPPDDDEDLEWAKQVVSRLTLNASERPPKEVSVCDTPASPMSPKKRTPQKNISLNTTMATTRRLSGHDLMIKQRLSGIQPPLVKKGHLAATKEEEEDEREESSATAFVSDGSTHTPTTPKCQGSTNPLPPVPQDSPGKALNSPGKRKSPSWKKTDSVNSSPVKHGVSQTNLGVCVHISPPLTDNQPSAKESSSKINGSSNLYTLEDFRQGKVSGVDMDHWEQFLLVEEFEKNFCMSKKHFGNLPKWKQLNAKRPLRTWP